MPPCAACLPPCRSVWERLILDAPLPILHGFINVHGGTHLFYVPYAASTPCCANPFFYVLVPADGGDGISPTVGLCGPLHGGYQDNILD
jgi:hypothetical protein